METINKIMKVDELRANPWNPNEMSEKMMNHLIRELNRVGFLQPVLINKGGMIIDGEHRWLAAKAANLKEIPVIEIDVNSNDAKILTINMNEIKGENNPLKLAQLLKDLKTDIDLNKLSEYLNKSAKDLESYDLLLSFPEIKEEDLIPKQQTAKEVVCPKCGWKFTITKN